MRAMEKLKEIFAEVSWPAIPQMSEDSKYAVKMGGLATLAFAAAYCRPDNYSVAAPAAFLAGVIGGTLAYFGHR
jgi:hypothetical protein